LEFQRNDFFELCWLAGAVQPGDAGIQILRSFSDEWIIHEVLSPAVSLILKKKQADQ